MSRAIRATPGLEEILIHTGQHYDDNMSRVFFEELGLPKPDRDLGVGSGPQGAQTGRMLEAIEERLLEVKPNWVVVYGDTNSTLAGALAGVKLRIRVAHVEAGLRSFNRRMPEEINRVVADHVSDLLFAPTEIAVGNLSREGIDSARVVLVGDVMFDAWLHYEASGMQRSIIHDRLGLKGDYVLGTIHRAENTDDLVRLRTVLEGFAMVADRIQVLVPLHPRTRSALTRAGLVPPDHSRLRFIEPVGYHDMLALERRAQVIATDSGGVQKEAYWAGIPCVTVRNETEWTELIELRWNRLAPADSAKAVAAAILSAIGTRGRKGVQPYGRGDASLKIAEILRNSVISS